MPRLLSALLIPLGSAALYLAYLQYTLRKVTCKTTPYYQLWALGLRPHFLSDPYKYIIHHEVASKRVSARSVKLPLDKGNPRVYLNDLLLRYVRHTMTAFAGYPPAYMLYYLCKSPEHRKTFDKKYLQELDFEVGDRVCGVYVVSSRTKEQVVLDLDPPLSYKGPKAEGMIVVEAELEDITGEGGDGTKEVEQYVIFKNHTVMWRKKGEGEKGPLESVMGRWVHGLMVRGLVEGGVRALMK